MGKYLEYTDDDVIREAAKVTTLAGLLKALGLRTAGGNYGNMKRKLQRLNVDTSHWTGQSWSKGQQLKDWSSYSKGVNLKPHLVAVKSGRCDGCGLSEWRGSQIPLEVHHKDGDRTNNHIDNLELLCCNCHALTDTWRRANK